MAQHLMRYPLDSSYLKQHCQRPWSDVVVFDAIDSTSNWVKQQPDACLACLAEQQTAGRGRHGHQWESPDAENIYLSFSWQFEKTPEHLGLLSLWVGIVVAEVLAAQGLQSHGIKWPNDIYWQQKKMGGILVEASNLTSRLIIGIGLNVNMAAAADIDQPWTSVSEVTQRQHNRNELLVPLLDALYAAMIEFPHLDEAEFMRRWKSWDLIRGKQVTFSDSGNEQVGEAQGVDWSGQLKVQLPSEGLRYFGTSIRKVRWQ